MLKDKEVVSDPQRQYEIARNVHTSQHGGINKTTATIAEKFHWVRIKETVSLVIKNCPDCKESAAKAPTVRPMGDHHSAVAHIRRAASGTSGQNPDPNSMIERLVNFDQMEPPAVVNGRRPVPAATKSRSPETLYPRVPVANMQALQDYNDIPLDPQIMGPNHIHSQFHHHHSPPPLSNSNPPVLGEAVDGEHAVDTRLATERHVRQGDEPMAFQDGDGVVHDVNGEREGDEMDLEELLTRG